MQQDELFDINKDQHGATWWAGNWQIRNFHGWLQSREGGAGLWQFQIHGFSGPEGGDGLASVMRVTGRRDVPIDRHNRILIEGKRYGRAHWNH